MSAKLEVFEGQLPPEGKIYLRLFPGGASKVRLAVVNEKGDSKSQGNILTIGPEGIELMHAFLGYGIATVGDIVKVVK